MGAYTDTASVTHAFLLSNGLFTSFDPPGAIFPDASGINPGKCHRWHLPGCRERRARIYPDAVSDKS
jgi:hypothetical protein